MIKISLNIYHSILSDNNLGLENHPCNKAKSSNATLKSKAKELHSLKPWAMFDSIAVNEEMGKQDFFTYPEEKLYWTQHKKEKEKIRFYLVPFLKPLFQNLAGGFIHYRKR